VSGNILQRIVETKRSELAEARARRPIDEVREAAARTPPPRDFYAAIAAPGPIRVIAEIKQASPSGGLLRDDFDPVLIARACSAGGAAAISVLTDKPFFRGDLSFIGRVKGAVKLPVLRKDFLIEEYQVHESRAAGADAILLIAGILSPAQIGGMVAIARAADMTCIVEVHDAAELEAVSGLLQSGGRMLLGINNRDLARQVVDLGTTGRLARLAPKGIPIVAESGIATREDLLVMQEAGASAALVGEVLMRAPDAGAKLRELLA